MTGEHAEQEVAVAIPSEGISGQSARDVEVASCEALATMERVERLSVDAKFAAGAPVLSAVLLLRARVPRRMLRRQVAEPARSEAGQGGAASVCIP